MDSLVTVNNEKINKPKGVYKNVVKNIRSKKYIDVLFNKNLIRHEMKGIKSKLHIIGAYDVCRIYLSCFDDKKYIIDDGTNGLAYFRKYIRNQ